MENHRFKPESLMMSYGYKPELSQGAIKCPIFQTSTFVFDTAEHGKAYFEVAYGLREKNEKEELGLIYSRLNNPDLEILENRLCLWDQAEDCAVFESGMSAISTVFLEFLKPGDLLLYSQAIYGGTSHFIESVLTKFGVHVLPFNPTMEKDEIDQLIKNHQSHHKLAMIYIETPSNPTNTLIDIQMCKQLCSQFSTNEKQVLLAVDNTYMGPLWQHPLSHGADIVLYSATKYIGGHSDVIAGACLGSKKLISQIRELRTFLGNMASPNTGWLLMRSLETLKIRMEKQAKNAAILAEFLHQHEAVEQVYYLGMLDSDRQAEIYEKQCLSGGAMLSFDIVGGEREAFQFLNSLKLIKLAVSLGGTESLVEHPASMTHSAVAHKNEIGITDKLIRLSVGIENPEDLIWDLEHAFKNVSFNVKRKALEA
ncbi:MAG: cystathionine gamma-synthase family protein [Calditrichaeota bacterium]|nr:cystathionine gamma-synthase family protein [Calditrichota bacterium]